MAVTWSVSPAAGAGSVDASGKFTAPNTTPSPATATVTATSHANATASGSANVTLATAFPSAPATIGGSTGSGAGVFAHGVATNGKRAYAVWAGAASTTPAVMIARSDDGGGTWKAPVAALKVTLAGTASGEFTCPAVAIDPVNPDLVYVGGHAAGNNLGDAAAGATNEDSALLAVSTDGGTSFTPYVMWVSGPGGAGPGGTSGWTGSGTTCLDVAAPAANAVAFEAPGGFSNDGNPDIAIWFDANKGAGFASGSQGQNGNIGYVANGATGALNNLKGNHEIAVQQNGGTDDAGGVTEAPRLFGDGAGRLCISYFGKVEPNGGFQSHAYVQCSADGAKTFTPPLVLDPSQPFNVGISSPIGALGANKAAAVLWTNGLAAGKLLVATSTDAGLTFGAPTAVPTYVLPGDKVGAPPLNPDIAYDAAGVLWVAYRVFDGVSTNRIIVDKSCDGGKTWSGAVVVNGAEGALVDLRFPALSMTPDAAPHLLTVASDHLAFSTLTP
ncbi:MAG TPA: sialidase family protein [Polyangiaceae bacterium]